MIAIALIEFLVSLLAFQLATVLNTLAIGAVGDWLVGVFLFVLLPALLAFGLGALSLLVAARLFRQIPLRRDTMWALVLCTIVLIPIKNLFLLSPTGLFNVQLSVVSMCLIAAGLFTAGRRYWRY